MRARPIVVALALLAPSVAGAADLDQAYATRRIRVRTHRRLRSGPRRAAAGPDRAGAARHRARRPAGRAAAGSRLRSRRRCPVTPPPLIAAIPIIGEYLVPAPLGPPPATVLDAYDHRNDYK